VRSLLLVSALVATVQAASAQAIVWPDPTLTPGAVRTTDVVDICSTDTRSLRHGSRERSDLIYARYGVARSDEMQYTLDHLIPLEIGGADVVENLWPEPRRSLAGEWDDTRKDQLERRLKVLVCDGALDVRQAQQAISEDWTEVGWSTSAGKSSSSGDRLTFARPCKLALAQKRDRSAFAAAGDATSEGSVADHAVALEQFISLPHVARMGGADARRIDPASHDVAQPHAAHARRSKMHRGPWVNQSLR
jgi:hypothetical protein